MKTFFAILIAYLICSLLTSSAQVLPSCLKINFLEPTSPDKYDRAEYGTKVTIKITNVNRNLYKIDDSLTQTDQNIDRPTIFGDLKFPPYVNLSVAIRDTVFGRTYSATESKLDMLVQTINESATSVKKAVLFNNAIVNLSQSCGVEYEVVNDRLIKETNAFLAQHLSTRSAQEQAIRTKLHNILTSAVAAKTALPQELVKELGRLNYANENHRKTVSDWEKNSLPRFHKDYASGRKTYEDSQMMLASNAAYAEHLKKTVSKAIEIADEIEKFQLENKAEAIVTNYRLINETNFAYTMDEFEVKKDEVQLNISVVANKLLPCEGFDKLIIDKTFPTVGGMKVDFSTGVFFNFGGEDFLGRELRYQKLDAENTSIESVDGGNRTLLSVGALMHIYRRSGRNVNWALSPGLSTTTSFDGLNLHLGGSLLVGKKNRLVLTAGWTLRETQILDRRYSYNVSYKQADLPETPPSIKVFPISGGFVALTYNWTVLKKAAD